MYNIRKRAAAMDPPPSFIVPQLPVAGRAPPNGADWLYEIKRDGYRALGRIENREARIFTRGNQDWTEKFRSVASELGRLKVKNAFIDGEICATDKFGNCVFSALQEALGSNQHHRLVYIIFDLMHLNGRDLRQQPLIERKRLLRQIIPENAVQIRYSDHLEGSMLAELRQTGDFVFRSVCQLGAEGIVAKRRSSTYRSGRNNNWIKVKCIQEEDFVIGGYLGKRNLGSLLVGYYEGDKFIYAGKVGTGFSDKDRADLFEGLKGLSRPTSPFASIPSEYRKANWVEPLTVTVVAFQGWTSGGLLRHPSYRHLRADKTAQEVRRDTEDKKRAKKTTKTPSPS